MRIGFGIGIDYQYPTVLNGVFPPPEEAVWMWNDGMNILWGDETEVLTE